MTAIFIRERDPELRIEDGFVPDSFFAQFGHDTASVIKDWHGKYQVTTFSDLGRRKRERQAERLRHKQETWCAEHVRPIYVWVFHCPGVFGFAYYGWWTYLVWRGGDSGKYLARDEETVRHLMELFPLGDSALFGPALTHDQWRVRFAKAFCCRNPDGTARKHGGRIQGKALLWAEFHGQHFERILGRAYLPSKAVWA